MSVEDERNPAQRLLAREARRVDGDPVLLRGSHPAAVACAWAAHDHVDLLVAAAHRGLLARMTLGSFASYLAHHAPCPTLLVRRATADDGPDREDIRHIACCVDGSPSSSDALARASRLADFLQARLSVLHVEAVPFLVPLSWSEPPGDDFFTAAERHVATLAQAFENAEPVPIFGFGYPPALACAWADEQRVDLLVAAAHTGLAARLALGSFTSYLAYHAPCSVLVTRPPARPTRTGDASDAKTDTEPLPHVDPSADATTSSTTPASP